MRLFSSASPSPVNIGSPLDKWDELNLNTERNGNRKWKLERRRSSKNSSNEFLWWVADEAIKLLLGSRNNLITIRQTQQSSSAENEQRVE